MTQETPRRLLDDPSVDARLRRDLANTRTLRADYDVQTGLRTLSAALGGIESDSAGDTGAGCGAELAGSSSPGAAWPASLRALSAKWWGLSAAGVASLAVWWVQLESPELRAPPRAPSAWAPTQVETTASSALMPVGTAPADSPATVQSSVEARAARPGAASSGARSQGPRSAPARGAARPAAPSSPHPLRTAHRSRPEEHRARSSSAPLDARLSQASGALSSRPSGPQTTQPSAEVEHLARLRKLLATDPMGALEAAREGQKRFADGLFAEERAALIVFALARLGRARETLHEARNFLRDYPSGPFVARVHEIAMQLEGRTP